MKPAGHTAVMADHARGDVAGDDARQALFRKLEYFPTPPWAARAGGELIQALDPGDWFIWEPACGQGHMADGLADFFNPLRATDIHDHGGAWQCLPPLDFLSSAADSFDDADWIVTNPPFGLAAAFVEAGLRRARRGVAILARATFYESAGRYDLFHGSRPCGVKGQFFERVPMQLGVWDPRGSTATAYAWFLWFQPSAEPAWVTALRATMPGALATIGIKPGAKARLSRPDDARRFGVPSASPLFEVRT